MHVVNMYYLLMQRQGSFIENIIRSTLFLYNFGHTGAFVHKSDAKSRVGKDKECPVKL